MDLPERAAQLFGNSPALRMPEKTLTFLEYNKRVIQIANRLYQKGLHAEDIVAIVSPNTPELLMLLGGVLKAGMIAAPLNNRFPEHRLRNTLEKLGPELVLTSSLEPLSYHGFTMDTVTSIIESAALCPVEETFELQETMERAVSIIHTSASTGDAKAAVHSMGNHWFSALGSNENIPFSPGDCWLLSLPLYHIGGYAMLYRSLVTGGSLAIGHLDDSIAVCLQKFPVTHVSLVPTQLYRLLTDTKSTELWSRMKAVLLGGSPAPQSLIDDAIRHNVPLYLSYGSTEMCTQIATTREAITTMLQNSGQVLPYREIMVAEDGELLVKGSCLFKGYLKQGGVEPQTDNDGWFHTADIGRVSEDGAVTVLGRKDNMFISGGENIHPEEIEKALMMIDGVQMAIVVPVHDTEYGQRPGAYIQTFEENKPDDDAIVQAMNALVGKLKTPVVYWRVCQWTMLSGSQKADRAWYKRLAEEH